MLSQQADIEGGVLLGGECVEVPSDLIDRLGDGRGRPVLSAFEEEMLENVGGTGSRAGFVAGAGTHPESDAHRSGISHPLGGQWHTRRQHVGTDHELTVPVNLAESPTTAPTPVASASSARALGRLSPSGTQFAELLNELSWTGRHPSWRPGPSN